MGPLSSSLLNSIDRAGSLLQSTFHSGSRSATQKSLAVIAGAISMEFEGHSSEQLTSNTYSACDGITTLRVNDLQPRGTGPSIVRVSLVRERLDGEENLATLRGPGAAVVLSEITKAMQRSRADDAESILLSLLGHYRDDDFGYSAASRPTLVSGRVDDPFSHTSTERVRHYIVKTGGLAVALYGHGFKIVMKQKEADEFEALVYGADIRRGGDLGHFGQWPLYTFFDTPDSPLAECYDNLRRRNCVNS